MTREGRAFLKELLDTINVAALRGLKFLITSRPDPNIARLCASFVSEAICRLYEVPRATIQADIMTYLEAELPAFKDHEELTKLADKADGLFIYAATAVRYITPRSNMAKSEQLELIGEAARRCITYVRKYRHTIARGQLIQTNLMDCFFQTQQQAVSYSFKHSPHHPLHPGACIHLCCRRTSS